MTRALLVLILASLSAACGGSDETPANNASASGTFDGVSFPVVNAVSAQVADSKGTVSAVILTTDANLCAELGAGKSGKSQKVIALYLYKADNTTTSHAATDLGDYAVTVTSAPGNYVEADFTSEDATCTQDVAHSGKASGGKVTLTAINGSAYKGTFSLTLGSETMTGSFDSTACAAVQTLYDGNTTCN
ncbi:MAG: hypothetical protein JST92_15955 [Deltaproteobacteria bacterium]|nr:hypothetical protein [Deltaproteobacteria bacterium]